MYLTNEVKKNIFKQYGKSEFDTGSAEGQVALFTNRIQHLTEHLKKNDKDSFTRRSWYALLVKEGACLII